MNEPIKTVIDAKEYSKLQAENQRLHALLLKVEWGLGAGRCPACFGANLDGHYPGCELDAALNTESKD